MSGLRIYVSEIPRDGCHIEGEIAADVVDLMGGDVVESCEPLKYELDVSVVTDELLVFGAISICLKMQCSRCSAVFPVSVEESLYSYNEHVEKTMEYADLTVDMREAIILAFSSYPVCSLDCKGLCGQCGANLNDGDCDCKPVVNEQWAGLDGLG